MVNKGARPQECYATQAEALVVLTAVMVAVVAIVAVVVIEAVALVVLAGALRAGTSSYSTLTRRCSRYIP